MAETVLDSFSVKLIGDGSSYKQMMQDATVETKAAGQQVEKAGNSFHVSHRALHALAHSMTGFAHGEGGLEGFAASFTHVGMRIGMMFGGIGMAVGAAMMIGTTLIHKFGDETKKAAGKAFGEFVTGAKNADEAIASMRIEQFKERLTKAAEASTSSWSRFWASMSPTNMGERLWQGKATWMISEQEMATKKVNEALNEQIKAQKTLADLMESDAGKQARAYMEVMESVDKATKKLRELSTGKMFPEAPKEIGDILEELTRLERRRDKLFDKLASIDPQEWIDVNNAIKLQKDLLEEVAEAKARVSKTGAEAKIKAGETDKEIVELRKYQAYLESLGKGGLAKEYENAIDKVKEALQAGVVRDFAKELSQIGMGANEKKMDDLARAMEHVGDATELMMAAQGRVQDYLVQGATLTDKLKKETESYGKSEADMAIIHLEEAKKFDQAFQLKNEVMKKFTRDMTKANELFELEMAGATKAQLAFASAADPVAKALAYNNALNDSAKSVMESLKTPTDKYADSVANLDELLANHKITQDQYNMALARARSELQGVREAQQGIEAGSAEALSHILAYQDTLMGMRGPTPALPSRPSTDVGSAEAKSRLNDDKQTKLQSDMLDELRKINANRPAIKIAGL